MAKELLIAEMVDLQLQKIQRFMHSGEQTAELPIRFNGMMQIPEIKLRQMKRDIIPQMPVLR